MLTIKRITLSRGNKILIEKSSVSLHEKQKIGLIGRNGCGKSSLFSFLLGQLAVDQGELQIDPELRISHLSQELPETTLCALDFVIAGDQAYQSIQERLQEALAHDDHDTVLACHELLNQTAGYSKPAMAASLLAGLGFNTQALQQSVNQFSGLIAFSRL